jgi:hypothetical protein
MPTSEVLKEIPEEVDPPLNTMVSFPAKVVTPPVG